MTLLTSAGVESLKADAKGVAAKIKTKDGKVEEKRFSHCIVAVGIAPNTENIGLEKLGVKTTKGHIDTDAMCRTNVPGISAIGDVTAPPWLAHKASHEGDHRGRGDRAGAGQQGRPSRTRWIRRTSRAAPIATRRSPASA